MTQFGLFFLAIFLFGIIAAFIYGPVWAFYLYELVYFFNPGNRWWYSSIPSLSYSFFTTLTLLVLTIFHWNKQKNTLKEMPEIKWFIGLILSYFFVSLFAANDLMHQRFLGYLITSWIVMLIACFILDELKKVEHAMLFLILGSGYIGYEAFNIGRNIFGRIEGIGTVDSPEANTIAATIIPALVFCTYFVWRGSTIEKIIALVCGALIANGLVLINSRGAFLGTVLAFGYFGMHMMFAKYKLPKQRLTLFGFVIAGIFAVITITDAIFWERMATLLTQSSIESEGSGGRRMNFWLVTFDMVRDYPFGLGIYGYETLSVNYLPEEWLGYEFGNMARAVHSIWFQGLSEVGWIGFALFMALLLSLKLHLRKAKKELIKANMLKYYYMIITLEAGAVGFLVASSFINMFRSNGLYLLLGIGIAAAVVSIRVANENASKKDSVSEFEQDEKRANKTFGIVRDK